MRIDQLVASAVPGDAVTDQAFAWQAALRSWGVGSEIVAEHVHPGLAGHVAELGAGRNHLGRADALVLHYSVWSRAAQAALAAPPPLVLAYHNITPGDLLRPYNASLAALCDRARARLPDLVARCIAAIADSHFNAAELEELGLETVVVPLLLNLPPKPLAYAIPGSTPLVLFVGRIAPNKRLEDAIASFDLFRRRVPQASFVLVGSDVGFERYRARLERLARRLDGRVRFTGRVTREERDECYRRASVYLSTSVHEGFCAPAMEALAHGVPVVARAAGAVPETLGDAGLLVESDDPGAFASALDEAVSSEQTRAALAEAAARRIAELQPERVARRLRAALEPVLTG
jgi:glycosyltransferase involved in cell wall biosynthesis